MGPIAAIGVLVPLAVIACAAHVYHDLTTLYEDTIALNDACWVAQYNLASYLEQLGRIDDAVPHYRAAFLNILPSRRGTAAAFIAQWRPAAGSTRAQDAVKQSLSGPLTDRERADATVFTGNILGMQERYDEAIEQYRAAIKMRPGDYVTFCAATGCCSRKRETSQRAIEKSPALRWKSVPTAPKRTTIWARCS